MSSSSSYDVVDDLSNLSLSSSNASLTDSVPPTHANLQTLNTVQPPQPTERRQFVCPEHGSYWKKVPAGGNKMNGACVARCKKCPVVNGVGIKYVAIPVEQERGKGLFTCRVCENTWTSNTACRSLSQYCWAEDCTARDDMIGEYPREVRAPDPGWLRAKRFASRQTPTIHEDAPLTDGSFNEQAGANNGGFNEQAGNADAAFTELPGAFGGDAGDPAGGFGGGGGGGDGGGGGGFRGRRKHFCSGCATGACKQPPPLSIPHESTGSTAATMSGKTWSTCNSEWSLGSVHSDVSPAGKSGSRRRKFLGGGRVADATE